MIHKVYKSEVIVTLAWVILLWLEATQYVYQVSKAIRSMRLHEWPRHAIEEKHY